jgi:hypothetical protein
MSITLALEAIARQEMELARISGDIQRATDRDDSNELQYYRLKWANQRGMIRGMKDMLHLTTGQVTA